MDKNEKAMWALIILVSVGFICLLFLQAYVEMKTFNKYSIVNATYVEALFSNLRITN